MIHDAAHSIIQAAIATGLTIAVAIPLALIWVAGTRVLERLR